LDDNPEVKGVIVGHRAKCVWLKRKAFQTTENFHELILDLLFGNSRIHIEQKPRTMQQVIMAATDRILDWCSRSVHRQHFTEDLSRVLPSGRREEERGDHESNGKFLALIIEVEVEVENTAMAIS
jgi:hypothetical protein